MAIVFFGTPPFAVPSLKALHEAGEDIAAVVTRRDAPAGRTKKILPTPVKELALAYGIHVLQPGRLDEDFTEELAKTLSFAAPEFLVVTAYGRILPRRILSMPRIAPVNVHASLLPRWRGASPIARSIINGDSVTGVTTMLMNEGMDTGEILLQEKTEIRPEDDAGSLSGRLAAIGAGLLLKTLKGMREGAIKPRPQEGPASYAPPLKKEDGLIDWGRPAKALSDFVRGMSPWPGAYFFLAGERIRVIKARAVDGLGSPGVVGKARGELLVGAGEGLLSLLIVQPEGKKPMPSAAFLQGRKIREGGVLSGAA